MKIKFYLLFIVFLLISNLAFSQKNSPQCKIDSIIDFAFNYMGTPYMWGEAGPYQFDCSGFMQFVFAQNGIAIKRTSILQNQQGEDVLLEDIKRGDLVFFFSGDYPQRDIGHVGMAISNYEDNNFTFIHSASSLNGVYISEFKERMYRRSYAGAKRIIPCDDLSEETAIHSKTKVYVVDTLTFDDVIVQNEQVENSNSYRLIHHNIKKGETLVSISRYYHISTDKIKRWNNLKTNSLDGIKRLKIYLYKNP